MINESRSSREDDADIPAWLKWTFIAINRVGFPVVAFFFMWYFSTTSIRKLSETLDRQSISLEALILTTNANYAEGKDWRDRMLESIKDLRNHVAK